MTEVESKLLLERWLAGDQTAAQVIFSRYFNRMSQLARTQLSSKIQVRCDAQDVAQSALRTFFEQAVCQNYKVERTGDLWRLLAAITINKAKQQVQFHRAAKRSIDKEIGYVDSDTVQAPLEKASEEPTPENALAIAEELTAFLQTIDPLERRVLELRLLNLSSAEIASQVGRSARTVRRTLASVKDLLCQRLHQVKATVVEGN